MDKIQADINFIPFGTDGVRGLADSELTPQLAQRLGISAAKFFLNYPKESYKLKKMIIGKDTRYSCDTLEHALASGISACGVDVEFVGVIPTPAVSYLTKHEGALAGVVISASHNPAKYNGIKFFNSDGLKLSENDEHEIESIYKNDIDDIYKENGSSRYWHDAKEKYIAHLVENLIFKSASEKNLKGMRIGIDCANGATFKIAPEIFKRLGATIFAIGTEPDGININDGCGSTDLDKIIELVKKENLDLGLAFDGDGDRVIAIDDNGSIVDGDYIMAICAKFLNETNQLKNNSVVITVMTNIGFDISMKEHGINILKSGVGDRYVIEKMLTHDVILGGEQSGHIIFRNSNSTGDGLVTALHLLEVMVEKRENISNLKKIMQKYPQKLINVNVADKKKVVESVELNNSIKEAEEKLNGRGRILVRPSGTESLIRVMVEAQDNELTNEISENVAGVVRKLSDGKIL